MVYSPPSTYISVLKFTIDGRPSIEDIHDLFSSLVTQIPFSTHKYMFRSYNNTFISEDAIKKLTAQPFSKEYTGSDSNFSGSQNLIKLNKDMAKALIQQFLWTRLIENAHEQQNRTYKDKGIWRLTSKGLCVLQEFCLKTRRDMSEFGNLIDTSSRFMFLMEIERLKENDRFNCERDHISSLFAIMIASLPLRYNNSNNVRMGHPQAASYQEIDDSYSISSSESGSTYSFSNGLSFSDYFPFIRILPNDSIITANAKHPYQFNYKPSFYQQKILFQNLNPTSNKFKMRAIFSSMLCCDWLVEYCTVASNDEAENIMTEFLNLGWITFYNEKYRHYDYIESSKSMTLNVTKAGMKVVVDISLEKYNQLQQSKQQQMQQQQLQYQHQQYQQHQQQQYPNPSLRQIHENRLSMDLFDKRNSFASSIGSASYVDTMNSSMQSPKSFDEREKLNIYNIRSKTALFPSIHSTTMSPTTSNSLGNSISSPLFDFNLQGFGNSYFEINALDPSTLASNKKAPSINNMVPLSATPIVDHSIHRESNLLKLKTVLKDEHLQLIFRDYLCSTFCVEALDFWLDYEKFTKGYLRQKSNGTLNLRRLLEDAYILWDTYLKPGTLRELNIDHTIRGSMAEEMSNIVTLVHAYTSGQTRPTIMVSQASNQNLVTILSLFDKVNDEVCILMANDSIPRFILTTEYLETVQKMQHVEEKPQHITHQSTQAHPVMLTNDLDDFPPPPQRQLKETIYL